MRYRTRPTEVEAVQFLDTTEGLKAVSEFMDGDVRFDCSAEPARALIKTFGKVMGVAAGDWLVRFPFTGVMPCPASVFAERFEAA